MKNDKDPLTEKSRSHLRLKRRKTNIILNSLIAVVLLLIIIVSINIFGSDEKNNVEEVASSVENTEENNDKNEKESVNREDDVAEEDQDRTQEDTDENKEEDEAEEDAQDELIISEGGADPDVKQSIVNPGWEPVGTTQSGGPAQDYNMSGTDWQEMIAAVSSATGFDESKGDILYRLGNNGPQKSVATIVKKDTNQRLRVYIEWVDGQGWKPVLVEEVYN